LLHTKTNNTTKMKKRLTAEDVLEMNVLRTRFMDMARMCPDDMGLEPFDNERHDYLVYCKLSCDFFGTPKVLVDPN